LQRAKKQTQSKRLSRSFSLVDRPIPQLLGAIFNCVTQEESTPARPRGGVRFQNLACEFGASSDASQRTLIAENHQEVSDMTHFSLIITYPRKYSCQFQAENPNGGEPDEQLSLVDWRRRAVARCSISYGHDGSPKDQQCSAIAPPKPLSPDLG
jgi:hypothetical protein